MDKQSLTPEVNLFKLPINLAQASIVLIPVPWAVTVPTHSNASLAPYSVLKASHQIDLFDKSFPLQSDLDVCMLPIHYDWEMLSKQLRSSIDEYLSAPLQNAVRSYAVNKELISKVNNCAYSLKETIKSKALKYIKKGKTVAILGGDHSTPLGLIEAIAQSNDSFSILHIDAHCDLKKDYQGFKYSHASIMYNALKLNNLDKIVQLGVRDYAEEEHQIVTSSPDRIKTFWNEDVKNQLFSGKSWNNICQDVVANLSQNVYISLDIDGLEPNLCPGTGMPVPDGIGFNELIRLIQTIADAKKNIIGFDLCEVGPSENSDWDALVATRLLYKLCLITKQSQMN